MIGFIISLVISCAITWVLLILSMLLVSRIADLAFPPLVDFLWKSAIVVVGSNLMVLWVALLTLPLLGILVGFITFLVLMAKLFDFELWQIFVIVVGTWVIRLGLLILWTGL
jgi:hypothetical protein